MSLASVAELIGELKNGRMIILMDDEDRENEGDLVMAADCISADAINFMAKYGRGLICLTLTRDRCQQLNLQQMVRDNGTQHGTAFTVSIEAATGVSTGISAADRARTVQAAVAKNAKPTDLVQPGHIFPLTAQPGGVLTRAGHTEAGCDYARLAGFEPAAVIVEILNEDGTMARRPDLEKFATQHGLKIGTIADLIEYRALHEKTVERVAQCRWPTTYGEFDLITYRDTIDGQLHYALTRGDITSTEPVLTRVHVSDMLADGLLGQRAESSWSLHRSLQRIAAEGRGVAVVLNVHETGTAQLARIERLAAEDRGEDAPAGVRNAGLRQTGIGSQILSDLGVHKLRLLSAPKKYHALSGYKLEVVEFIDN